MNFLERLRKLEQKIKPNSVHIIYWEKFKGITKEEAINKYLKDNNIESLDRLGNDKLPYILVCIPSDEEIRERNK